MLKGKTAVITGGSRGIGRAIALKLSENGADVAILFAGNEAAARKTEEEASAFGGTARRYRCDVSDFSAVKETVSRIIKDFGRVDILVNNAGITRDSLLFSMKEEAFDAVLDTNLKGAFHMIKHCYTQFIRQRSGKIINISSVAGLMGNPGQANYAASKAGLIGLTKSVARELAGRGVCCNAIAPGCIETDMTANLFPPEELKRMVPLGRMGKPEDIAELALFLAGSGSDYITGEIIRVDGGMAM
ncbi:MAG: 3-oxoacyl-[acyl-carrier-protein] reductase [Oscillospiraceae bacterium]|nr:3-oxoacyl-[acyl-carrier-protein] reductase [Oscillospiraceae bacterium]